MITALLAARGLSVGTYTSPDLERVNERLAWNGEPIADDDLRRGARRDRDELEAVLDEPPTRFEILTAAAFGWFADVAVDVAVVEVGLGGRWDATNVADGQVAVVTNVSLDHQEVIGPTRADIATREGRDREAGQHARAGRDRSRARARSSARPRRAEVWQRDEDFGCVGNRLAHRRPAARPAHARRVLRRRVPARARRPPGRQRRRRPGRGRGVLRCARSTPTWSTRRSPPSGSRAGSRSSAASPLVVLDGAHNPAGAPAPAGALDEALRRRDGPGPRRRHAPGP